MNAIDIRFIILCQNMSDIDFFTLTYTRSSHISFATWEIGQFQNVNFVSPKLNYTNIGGYQKQTFHCSLS
jgi:hypothetical protein